jgi:hypothetical protein
MTDTPEEVARKFEEQTMIQRTQHEMIQAQQCSIDDLKNMVTLQLNQKKTKKRRSSYKPRSSPKYGISHSKNKDKTKEDDHVILESTEGEKNAEERLLESSSKGQQSYEH